MAGGCSEDPLQDNWVVGPPSSIARSGVPLTRPVNVSFIIALGREVPAAYALSWRVPASLLNGNSSTATLAKEALCF